MSDREDPEGPEPTEEEKRGLASVTNRLHDVVNMLEDKTKYTSLLELFNILKLPIITRLDKAHVDTITKFETYVASQQILYGTKEDDGEKVIMEMVKSFRTNQISKNGKSRAEVVEVLKDSYGEQQRDSIKRLTGGK